METRGAEKINRILGDQKGVSLVELMAAVLVISLSCLALYQMFVTGSGIITEQYHRRRALERAQAQLERIKYYTAHADSTPPSLRGTYTEVMVPGEEENDDPIMGEYTVRISYSDIHDDLRRPFFSIVTIDYRWKERDGREMAVKLKSNFSSGQ